MTERSYRGLLWALALVGALADQGTKYGVFHWLYNNGQDNSQAIIPGAFDLLVQFTGQRETGTNFLGRLRSFSGDALPRVNHGALFGMKVLDRLGLAHENLDYWNNALFAAISFLAAAAIAYWSTRRSLARDWLLCTALGLILGGTLGNLYDRLVFNGVRDFLHWHGGFEWPVFNIADCCLVVGAFLLLTQAVVNRQAVAPSAAVPAEEAVPTP
jgi:lipoprotein signal peptidase